MPQPVTVHHGECLDALRDMPDNSVDSIVTDPPYGLSNTTPDKVADAIVRWASGEREYTPKGRGFMGQAWDAFVPPPAVWDECYRVLKPGGHLAVFAGSRTQDLMGISIRLAQFEIRENVAWMYGSGFPKSHDIGKAIDKAAGAIREVVGTKLGQPGYSLSDSGDTKWGRLRNSPEKEAEVTAPATPEAEKWQGWGTALKPGHEPIILARKPFKGTVAANTLVNGVGGLNIDATRIDAKPGDAFGGGAGGGASWFGATGYEAGSGFVKSGQGRWPANVVLDPDTAAALDQQSGNRKGASSNSNGSSAWFIRGEGKTDTAPGYNDEGGASRFFKVVEPDPPFMYAAKAPKKERPVHATEDGTTVQHATVKPLSVMSWLVKLVTPPGGTVLDPFAGSGTTVEAAITNGFHVIGIEREAAYLPLIQQRIDRAQARATDEDPQTELDIAS